MWWYGYGWWWWWIAFLAIFFILPLIYGWGYRGWGPWYRRRRLPERDMSRRNAGLTGTEPAGGTDIETGWGWVAWFLWLILIIAVIWLIFAWAWGPYYTTPAT